MTNFHTSSFFNAQLLVMIISEMFLKQATLNYVHSCDSLMLTHALNP